MPIKFKCNSCQAVLVVKDELAGKKGLCPKCQKPITVPAASPASPAADGLSLAVSPAQAPKPPPAPAPAVAKPEAPAAASGGASPLDMKSAATRKLMVQKVGTVLVATIQVQRISEPPDIREVGDALMGLLDQAEKPQVLLDMNKVTYLPSSMIGKLTVMHKKALEYKGSLRFCNIAPGVLEIFKITRLDKVFKIYPDLNSALNSFKSGYIDV
ncbi:MAG: STAS domain-containing protein [Planctomycetes bacterium]|nr:STAS domain-containing protein [Planctomycetota bacterium]